LHIYSSEATRDREHPFPHDRRQGRPLAPARPLASFAETAQECGQVAEQLGYGRLTDTAPIHPAVLTLAGLPAAAQLVA
jgi:hypothetical protein